MADKNNTDGIIHKLLSIIGNSYLMKITSIAIVIVFTGIFMRGYNGFNAFSDGFISIGCSLLAAAIFTYCYQKKMDNVYGSEFNKKVLDNIEETHKIQSKELSTDLNNTFNIELTKYKNLLYELRDYNAAIVPKYVFDESNVPWKAYKETIDKIFPNSNQFMHKGITGPYLQLYKLRCLNRPLPSLRIELLLLDPRLDPRDRANNYVGYNHLAKFVSNGDIDSLKLKLLAFLLALFECKVVFDYDIYFYTEAPFLRYEFIDNILLMSVRNEESPKYPVTLVYDNNSVFHDSLKANFDCLRLASKGFNFHLNKKIMSHDFILKLAQASGLTVNLSDIRNKISELDEDCKIKLAMSV